MEGVFGIVSDTDNGGRHTAVLSVSKPKNEVLAAILSQGLDINSFRELMPRMNDIFIKLVTEGV